jgi:hypothetical protein
MASQFTETHPLPPARPLCGPNLPGILQTACQVHPEKDRRPIRPREFDQSLAQMALPPEPEPGDMHGTRKQIADSTVHRIPAAAIGFRKEELNIGDEKR